MELELEEFTKQCKENTAHELPGYRVVDSADLEDLPIPKETFEKHMLCVPEGFVSPWYANQTLFNGLSYMGLSFIQR